MGRWPLRAQRASRREEALRRSSFRASNIRLLCEAFSPPLAGDRTEGGVSTDETGGKRPRPQGRAIRRGPGPAERLPLPWRNTEHAPSESPDTTGPPRLRNRSERRAFSCLRADAGRGWKEAGRAWLSGSGQALVPDKEKRYREATGAKPQVTVLRALNRPSDAGRTGKGIRRAARPAALAAGTIRQWSS